MNCRVRTLALLAVLALLCVTPGSVPAADTPPTPEDVRFFESRIRPLLAERCFKCHGPEKQKSELRLDSAEALKKGGSSGKLLVALEKPDESLLLRAVRHA